ncbi:MAG: hypothetical protein ABS81_08520 [Pseudonocardia sp. SCN 72-86]|nr:MAG: hypothetical protein ABS81_08520 [Pseudonocardia sp. SCN 72-86]
MEAHLASMSEPGGSPVRMTLTRKLRVTSARSHHRFAQGRVLSAQTLPPPGAVELGAGRTFGIEDQQDFGARLRELRATSVGS